MLCTSDTIAFPRSRFYFWKEVSTEDTLLGHRANYVIIENGQAQIFFSRWGAVTIPSVLLSGPERTLAYIRQLTPDESLLDDIWAEGGVLVNIDTQRALFWGGVSISMHPYLRRPLLAALRVLWPGWSIDWAMFGVADLARNCGWDVSQVLDNEYIHTAFLTGSDAVVTDTQVLESAQTQFDLGRFVIAGPRTRLHNARKIQVGERNKHLMNRASQAPGFLLFSALSNE